MGCVLDVIRVLYSIKRGHAEKHPMAFLKNSAIGKNRWIAGQNREGASSFSAILTERDVDERSIFYFLEKEAWPFSPEKR